MIEKETNIGGIIESSKVLFRHFNLKYDDCEIKIRCTYYSYYFYRTLNIYCFEYHPEINKDNPNLIRETNERSSFFERMENNINAKVIDVGEYSQTLHIRIQ